MTWTRALSCCAGAGHEATVATMSADTNANDLPISSSHCGGLRRKTRSEMAGGPAAASILVGTGGHVQRPAAADRNGSEAKLGQEARRVRTGRRRRTRPRRAAADAAAD